MSTDCLRATGSADHLTLLRLFFFFLFLLISISVSSWGSLTARSVTTKPDFFYECIKNFHFTKKENGRNEIWPWRGGCICFYFLFFFIVYLLGIYGESTNPSISCARILEDLYEKSKFFRATRIFKMFFSNFFDISPERSLHVIQFSYNCTIFIQLFWIQDNINPKSSLCPR